MKPRARMSNFSCEGRFIRVRELGASYVALPADGEPLTTPANVAAIADERFGLRRDVQENVVVIFLDAKQRLIGVERIARGTVNAATVSARDILRNALLLNSAFIVCVHNHPSGATEPSSNDINFTRRLRDAAGLLNVDVLDHVIIGCSHDGSLTYTSLAARGEL
jgi:DNA repair protein RadC